VLIREFLRASTRAEHEKLDAYLRLGRSAPSREDYLVYLRGWLSYYRAARQSFENWDEPCHTTGDCDARIQWLEDDLRFLRSSPDVPPALHCLGLGDGAAEQFGTSYVLEGATLGAQTLARHLGETWKIAPGEGGSFLCGQGTESRGRWTRFVETLNSVSLTEGERLRCAAAAQLTFVTLHGCFVREREAALRAPRGSGLACKDEHAST
jgi:heme oxygenase